MIQLIDINLDQHYFKMDLPDLFFIGSGTGNTINNSIDPDTEEENYQDVNGYGNITIKDFSIRFNTKYLWTNILWWNFIFSRFWSICIW